MASEPQSHADRLTLRRVLNPNQQARRRRIVDAALWLAAKGGYEAVVMKDVARLADVSLGTVYRYFSSKDHLLADALLAWGGQLGERLSARPPRGATPAARVGSIFQRMARGVEAQPELGVALTRALLSQDPSTHDNASDLRRMLEDWIDVALAEEPVRDREGVIEVLQHVCFSCMIGVANGSRTPRSVGDELERAARLLLSAD